MSSDNHKNMFECDCSPRHVYRSVEDFNKHFTSIYHRYYECSSKTLFKDYMRLQEDLKKIQEERDMWKTMYQDEFTKDRSL